MGKRKFKEFLQDDFYSAYMYRLMPPNRLLEEIVQRIDFAALDDMFEHLYSSLG